MCLLSRVRALAMLSLAWKRGHPTGLLFCTCLSRHRELLKHFHTFPSLFIPWGENLQTATFPPSCSSVEHVVPKQIFLNQRKPLTLPPYAVSSLDERCSHTMHVCIFNGIVYVFVCYSVPWGWWIKSMYLQFGCELTLRGVACCIS